MEKHIISNCLKVDHLIREAIIYMVKAREHKISSGTNVKRQNNDQTILEDFYENSDS
ncbi:3540_t:CDS:1, partial [Rhizophagus irregularis]